jgi:hypothetical protein
MVERESSGNSAFTEVVEDLEKSNPNLLKLVVIYCENYKDDPRIKKAVSSCSFMLYKLLSSQGEADSLKEDFIFEDL